MTQPLLIRSARAAFALLAIAAWLVATNHCALADLTAPAAAEHEQCPGHKTPADEQKEGECDGSSCCKGLSAPLAQAKNLGGSDLTSFLRCSYPPRCLHIVPPHRAAVVLELDTGPPAASSFAESVLQRSLLAHAPPISA